MLDHKACKICFFRNSRKNRAQKTNPEGDPAKKEISSAKNLIGQKVKIATDDSDSAISQIKIEVENFVSTVKKILLIMLVTQSLVLNNILMEQLIV